MKTRNIELKEARDYFPALQRKIKGKTLAFFDGPGGTQVPKRVIRAISNYYRFYNTNTHGEFQTSIETDRIIQDSRRNMAIFLGAEDPSTISVGQNMTTLNFSLSRAFSRLLVPGDEVLITQLDHEANRGPWLSLRSHGVKVREVDLLDNGTLDYEDLKNKVTENTRLVAIGWASNAFGTVNDIRKVRELTYKAGAFLLVDAVHYAPHFPVSVQDFGMDFLLCSSYKFYGPHLGFLYSKPGQLDKLPVDRLSTQEQMAPYSIETGTLNHASLAGVNAAIAFISSLGEGKSLRDRLATAFQKIGMHEKRLAELLYNEIGSMPNLRIIGPDFSQDKRAPTISFVHDVLKPIEICRKLAENNITAWDGHFYAQKAIEVLGLSERGGVTRLGISLYNNDNDIDKVVEVLKSI
jgi:cysteine desulfurase family protein (TIGR01976 family)